jgi:hypothetical protein
VYHPEVVFVRAANWTLIRRLSLGDVAADLTDIVIVCLVSQHRTESVLIELGVTLFHVTRILERYRGRRLPFLFRLTDEGRVMDLIDRGLLLKGVLKILLRALNHGFSQETKVSFSVHAFRRSYCTEQLRYLAVALVFGLAGECQQPMMSLRLTDEGLV